MTHITVDFRGNSLMVTDRVQENLMASAPTSMEMPKPTGTVIMESNGYTFIKNLDTLSLKITRLSPRARGGVKVVEHFRYRSLERLHARMDEFLANVAKRNEAKAVEAMLAKEAKANFTNPFVKDQILYNSWGYDQTNIDYFQVVSVKGKSIMVRPIEQSRERTYGDGGTCTPCVGKFTGEAVKKTVRIRVWSGKVVYTLKDLSAWDGTPKSWSDGH